MNMYNVVSLQSFTVFSEYFIALSIIYILIVITLITYNSYGLMLQKGISECVALVLFMSCYLIFYLLLFCHTFCLLIFLLVFLCCIEL